MKVKIYTFPYKQPHFISMQYASLSKFLKDDDYEYIILNNSVPDANEKILKEICNKLKLKCIDVEPNLRGSIFSFYQWIFSEYIQNDSGGLSVLIQPDIFLIREFSINDFMNGYDIAGVPVRSGNIMYLHFGFIIFNLDQLPNKDKMNILGGIVEGQGTEVGGNLYYWFKDNPGVRIRYIEHSGQICLQNTNLHLLPQEILSQYDNEYKFSIYEKNLLHYGRGSNWEGKSEEFHKNKTACMENLLKIGFLP